MQIPWTSNLIKVQKDRNFFFAYKCRKANLTLTFVFDIKILTKLFKFKAASLGSIKQPH